MSRHVTDWDMWRAELQRRGVDDAKWKLATSRRGGETLVGFDHGLRIPRDFIEDWIAQQERELKRRRVRRWAIIGVAAMAAGMIAAVAALLG
jgi:hypothetical protein